MLFFILLSKAFPDAKFFNRVKTWESRIENFSTNKPDEDDYQIEKAKIAIASGNLYGLGPGKSVQKNFLPQSSSDFIYAIIVEEYGLVGGFIVIGCYIVLIFRCLKIVVESQRSFAALAVLGIGFSMSFQAFVHMGVSVGKLPVTGLTLPLVSMGGTSLILNSVAFGFILGISRHIQIEKETELKTSVDTSSNGGTNE